MASDGMKDGAGSGAGSTYAFRQILATPRKTDADRGFRGDVLSQLNGYPSKHAGMLHTPTVTANMHHPSMAKWPSCDGWSVIANPETLPTPTKRDKRMDAWSPAYDKRKSPTMDAVLDGAQTGRAPDKWAYAALLGHRNRREPAEQIKVPKLIELYERSTAYAGLSDSSKKLYGIYLGRLEKMMPTAPVAGITRFHMQKLFDDMGATPAAANAFIATCRALFTWAKPRGYVTTNPCEEIEPNPGGEHAPWPDDVLAAALKATDDPVVRLLTHLLYYTGQRIGDALAMEWADIKDGRVAVVQAKTKKRLWIRLHESLAAELAKLTPGDGRIYSLSVQTARMRLQAFAAKHGAKVVPHGLRKNAVITLLEIGCSVAETAAISGQSLQMVEHYAKQRDQKALADSAISRWERTKHGRANM